MIIEIQWTFAQRQPEFQYTLFVEDARGKKDSVVLGYDRTEARLTLDSIFGEIDIKNRPFDSILELRATEARNRFDIKFHSKKIITFFEGICPENASSSNITLLIRAKYYPIKFSWNKNLFVDNCRSKSILVSSENYYIAEPPVNRNEIDSQYGTAYLHNQSEKVETFNRFYLPNGQVNPYFYYTFTAPTNAGRNDTIWTYAMSFRSEFINPTHEIPIYNLVSYPNPCYESLNIALSDYETGKMEIYDLTGRHIQSLKVESSNQLKIDVHDLNIGMYFLQFKTTKGKTYICKFVKS